MQLTMFHNMHSSATGAVADAAGDDDSVDFISDGDYQSDNDEWDSSNDQPVLVSSMLVDVLQY
jgi:hypothetical protein